MRSMSQRIALAFAAVAIVPSTADGLDFFDLAILEIAIFALGIGKLDGIQCVI